jgi:protein-S-isoprenylcysteine O-methyltransferase Ste14
MFSSNLLISAIIKLLVGIGMIAILLFPAAGTWHYPHAWVFMALLFVPMIIMGVWLYCSQPQLLAKRLNNKEKEQDQKRMVALSGLMFIIGFVLCGLDYRFAWSNIPIGVIIIASIIFLLGYAMYAEVMRENAYLSRTIEIQKDQQLIDSGLYGIVRHPMYSSTILMYLAMPIILGSLWALLVFAIYPILLVVRIKNEEKVLLDGLSGYHDYTQRVRYRLIPGVW